MQLITGVFLNREKSLRNSKNSKHSMSGILGLNLLCDSGGNNFIFLDS
jgi:hypothetical protein